MRAVLPLMFALAACGGGGGDDESLADAGSTADARTGQEADADMAGGADASAVGLPSTCEGACSTVDLTAQFGNTTGTFERAFFGLTAPAESDSGQWEIYLENNAGEDDACPTMSSPTPDFILVVTGLEVPGANPSPVSGVATLVDFGAGLLTESVFEEASANTVTWVAADPCIACAEGTEEDRPDRMIALDISATFSGGTISGHTYATHCDSLDTL